MCVKKTMFPCCRTVCCIHFFALIFPLQGGNETKRMEQEGNRVSAPVLVWVLFCLTSPIYPIDLRSFSSLQREEVTKGTHCFLYAIIYERDMHLMSLYVDCLSLKRILSEKNTGNTKCSMVSMSVFAYI